MNVKPLAAGAPAWSAPPAPRQAPARGVAAPGAVATGEAAAVGSSQASPAPERSLAISVDRDTGKTVVHVIDSISGEVIRQVPTEEMLAVARALGRLHGAALRTKA